MDNSIKIGKYMKIIVESDETLMSMVPKDKIFGLIAHEKTTYPYIVYSRSALNPQYNKSLGLDNGVGHTNIVQITVDCHGNDYEESIEVANAFRNALEGKGYKSKDIYVERFQLTSCYETTNGEGDFSQVLVFQTEVK